MVRFGLPHEKWTEKLLVVSGDNSLKAVFLRHLLPSLSMELNIRRQSPFL